MFKIEGPKECFITIVAVAAIAMGLYFDWYDTIVKVLFISVFVYLLNYFYPENNKVD